MKGNAKVSLFYLPDTAKSACLLETAKAQRAKSCVCMEGEKYARGYDDVFT